MSFKLLVHIVTFNSADTIRHCLQSIPKDSRIATLVTDNNSSDDSAGIVEREFSEVQLIRSAVNLGYAGAHNRGFAEAVRGGFDYVLLLNPDATLGADFLENFGSALLQSPGYAFYSPKILRVDRDMLPLSPPLIDAAGMVLNSQARHLDRGSEETDRGQFDESSDVFGGTGAALFVSTAALKRLELRGASRDQDKFKIYPQLKVNEDQRLQVFDEAFFAFREDAELAWRAKNIGLKTRYIPKIKVYHRRSVTPTRRAQIQPEINSWSVRNRFLMQIVNFRITRDLGMLLPGILIWNLVVLLGVFLKERSSLQGLREVVALFPRAWERRTILKNMS